MELVRGALLVISTLTIGLQAGLFYTFTVSIMRTLRGVDDRTFVNVMQRINRDIQNGWFGLTFAGGLVFTVLTLVLFIGKPGSVILPIVIGLVLYVVSLGTTFGRNIPMNIRLDKAGKPETMSEQGLVSARQAFEAAWTRANTFRGLLAAAASVALSWGLVEFGKSL
jgi:uncharacterized membrane protein